MRSTRRATLAAIVISSALLIGAPPARSGFPGSNGLIAFTSDRDGNQEIYAMNSDGTGQTNLTKNAARDFNPAWSPNGTKLAFTSDRGGSWDIYVMNADGTGVTRLTNHVALDWNPAWSPDGSKIVFGTYRYGGGEIAVMNADGTGVTRVTNNAFYDRHPKWSPDGSKIAFESDRNYSWEIVVMNTDGSGDIFVMNADGSGIINLSNDPAYDLEPAWSPDGSRIAFSTVQGGNLQIYTMTSTGAGKTPLTNNVGNDYDPDWQPGAGPPPPTSFTLTAVKAGNGRGSINSSPPGIRCGSDCQEAYASGTVVTLTVRVSSGSSFSGWSGACSGTGPCVVTMNAAKTVTATFMSP